MVPVYYLLSDFILALMWVRCMFILRAVFNYTIFMDIYSKKLCKSYGFTANVRFAFKCLITSSPGYTVCGVLFLSVLILAYLIRIFEMPYDSDYGLITWDSYFTSIWFIVITMTTVGFGDVYPNTTFGRLIAMFTALWGTFLISILILSVGNIFKLNKNEQQAHSHLLQTRSAAQSITAFMKYLLAKKRFNLDKLGDGRGDDNEGLIEARVDAADIARYKREMIRALADFKAINRELRTLDAGEQEKMDSMNLIKNQVLDLADRFDKMQANQEKQNLMVSFLVNKIQAGVLAKAEQTKEMQAQQLQDQINETQMRLWELQAQAAKLN